MQEDLLNNFFKQTKNKNLAFAETDEIPRSSESDWQQVKVVSVQETIHHIKQLHNKKAGGWDQIIRASHLKVNSGSEKSFKLNLPGGRMGEM